MRPKLTRERAQESMTKLPVVGGFVITQVIECWWEIVAKAARCHVREILGQVQAARWIHLPNVRPRLAVEVADNVTLIQTRNRFWATDQLSN